MANRPLLEHFQGAMWEAGWPVRESAGCTTGSDLSILRLGGHLQQPMAEPSGVFGASVAKAGE